MLIDAGLRIDRESMIAAAAKEVRLNGDVPAVSVEIAGDDVMHDTRQTYPYFRCGASALNIITAMLSISDRPKTDKVLDFGCGHGRVMRWLRAHFPDAAITGTDVTEAGIAFCAHQFGARAVASGIDFEKLPDFRGHDLIWSGSVFTHLTERDAGLLFDAFVEWLNPWGVAVFSTHGRTAVDNFLTGRVDYLPGQPKQPPLRDYFEAGYGYGPYAGTPSYGVSFVKPEWYLKRIFARRDISLIAYSERAWDYHQDIVAIQKLPV